jgi:8-oxo-dGTP diphosphatase
MVFFMSSTHVVRVVVGILQNAQQQFFIAKRPPQVVMPDYWEFPGGKIEALEDQLTALRREFQEEVGIHIQDATYVTTFQHIFPDRHIELHVWRIHAYHGEPCGNEGQEVRWVNLEQFNSFTFLPSNAHLLAFLDNEARAVA